MFSENGHYPTHHESDFEPHDMHGEQHHGPEEDDDSPEAFMARMGEAYASEKTRLDELLEVYANEGEGEHFETLLDDLVYEAIVYNPDFKANVAMVQNPDISEAERLRYRDKQRALFAEYRQAIVQEAGLPSKFGANELLDAKRKVSSIVKNTIREADNPNSGVVLRTLGVLQQDDEGKDFFAYPHGLFPESVDKKWEVYLEAVRNHLRIKRDFEVGIKQRYELVDADRARRLAHNAVTRDIDAILGLGSNPEQDWDFEKSRNLIAKMRDSRYPTIQTAEQAVTETAIVEAVAGMHAVQALSRRLSDFHKK